MCSFFLNSSDYVSNLQAVTSVTFIYFLIYSFSMILFAINIYISPIQQEEIRGLVKHIDQEGAARDNAGNRVSIGGNILNKKICPRITYYLFMMVWSIPLGSIISCWGNLIVNSSLTTYFWMSSNHVYYLNIIANGVIYVFFSLIIFRRIIKSCWQNDV